MNQVELLATPYEGAFYDLTCDLAWRQLGHITRSLIRAGEEQRLESCSMLDEVRARLDSAPKGTEYFSPESGLVLRALTKMKRTPESCQWMRAQLCVAAFLNGLLPNIALQIRCSMPVIAAGFSAQATDLTVEGCGTTLRFADGSGTTLLELHRHMIEGMAPLWLEAGGRSFPLRIGGAAAVLASSGHAAWFADSQREIHRQGEAGEEFRAQLEAAAALLENDAPEFYLWAAAVLKQVCPIARAAPAGVCSASNAFLPGVIQVTVPASLSETAEMIVHECSHQYLNLLTRFALLTRDHAGYHYSPLTRSKRRMDRILVGYHAFANIALLYERLKELGQVTSAEPRVLLVQEFLVDLEETLDVYGPEELSEAGGVIYQASRARRRSREAAVAEIVQ